MSNETANKFGVLKYSSQNIGDEIQSIAAMRFLPQIDYYIHRERTDKFVSDNHEKVKIIMNAWWMWNSSHFPPSDDIEPLLISMHLREATREKFLSEKTIKFLKKYGPVGCRDTSTLKYLKANKIDAYFSGCLTLALQGNPKLKSLQRSQYILCVDTPERITERVKERTDIPVYSLTRMLSPSMSSVDRMELSKHILYLYHNAHCVVTPRLHVTLPCIAFETPVLLIELMESSGRGRFDGMQNLYNKCGELDFTLKKNIYNFEKPKANPEAYLSVKESLIKTCAEFTGFNNTGPLFEENYEPLIELMNILKYDYANVKRTLWFAEEKDLLEVLFKKQNQKKTKHDLQY